jgi:hypothetical protein
VIGPASALVARRLTYPAFNPALRWKVDVDCYVRLLSTTVCKVKMAAHLKVASLLSHEHSITASLRAGLVQLERDELAWLRNQQVSATFWLSDTQQLGLTACLLMRAETLAWALVRITGRCCSGLGLSAAAPLLVRRALARAQTPAQAS